MHKQNRSPIISTSATDWIALENRGDTFDIKELSGEKLGAHLERLKPGQSSSFHHYHTVEEEHVFVIEGAAILHLGDETKDVTAGDHLCFFANDAQAHHLVAAGETGCTLLVYGERRVEDVVFYPESKVMMVKANNFQQYTYRPIASSRDSDKTTE